MSKSGIGPALILAFGLILGLCLAFTAGCTHTVPVRVATIPNGGGLTVGEVTACCEATPAHITRRQNGYVLCRGIEALCY